MDEANREELTERFRAYLDRVGEGPEESAQKPPDLYSLLTELAALKNEVKLESRQVKAALDQFRELFDSLRQTNAGVEDERKRRRDAELSSRHSQERGLLLELVELRDRFQAGLRQAQRYHPGWMARKGGAGDFAKGMVEGMNMNLRRFDNILARRGVRPIETLNKPFNPQTMHVVEVERHPNREAGLVVREIRAGFLHKGRLLRPAEVIVNKKENT